MKVLHIIDSGGLYGAEVLLLHLVAAQHEMGMKPVICSIGEPNTADKALELRAESVGISVHRVRMRSGMNLAGAMKILKYASNEEFDVLHSHGYKANILLGFLPRQMRRMPLISTLHGWTATTRYSALAVYGWLDRTSLTYHDAVVAVSETMLEDGRIPAAVRRKLILIPNGIPVVVDATAQDDTVDFCSQGFVIGAIGRLSPEKGFEYLLDAVASLVVDGKDIRLVLIGEGAERQRLEKRVSRLKLADRVHFAGYRENAGRYLTLFNAFVISSLTEGLPITLLEAMKAKTPIIATHVGAIPNALHNGKGGLLVSPKDKVALACAISQIIDNPERAGAQVEYSYRTFINAYTSDRMAERYLDVYRGVTA